MAESPDIDRVVGRFPDAPTRQALICFSHLRWGFVWQRPQHLLTRFARDFDVYVVEEPEFEETQAAAELRVENRDQVVILTPVLPATPAFEYGFGDTNNRAISGLLAPFFQKHGLGEAGAPNSIVWYYTPMALGAAPRGLDPALVVYDVMDELANFRGAPAAIRERERSLLARADLVFAGGPSLYTSRKGRHPRVFCFPSGVDAAHFARVHRSTDLDHLPRPIIGFYGVIDERIDLDLLAGIADRRPGWSIAMIGPVAKIDPDDLPTAPNLYYLGKRDYDELPGCLACFDAAILPFARNEATRFISPTKTLEYLSAGKPVVSTPIQDVLDLYGSVVEVAERPDDFVAAIERLWSEHPAQQRVRREASQRLVAEHSWDEIVRGMRVQIDSMFPSAATPDMTRGIATASLAHISRAEVAVGDGVSD
jgi:UDP-galactopyranose mutase